MAATVVEFVVCTCAVLLAVCTVRVQARIGTGFIKDQRTDFVDFPPKVYRQYDSPVPVGHLRPLGEKRRLLN